MYLNRYLQIIGMASRKLIRGMTRAIMMGESKKMLDCGNPEKMGYI